MPASWGKVSQGQPFGIVAYDFGRAMMAAGLGVYELSLLWFVMERSWGDSKKASGRSRWPDPIPVKLNLTQLCKSMGVARQRLSEARLSLLAKHILTETDAGDLINKNAEAWIDPKTSNPLLSKEVIRYAKSARPKAEHRTPQRAETARSSVHQPHAPACTPPHAPACGGRTPQRAETARSSVHPLIEERAAEDFKKTLEDPAGKPAGNSEARQPAGQPEVLGSPEECKEAARRAWGEEAAEAIGTDPQGMARWIAGRFDSLHSAILKLHSEGKEISDVRRLAITVANRITEEGPAAKPVAVGAKRAGLIDKLAAAKESQRKRQAERENKP